MADKPNTTPAPLSTVHRPILRAAGAIGILTAASRILGFARDCLIAAFYGTSPTAQAFVVAFRIPNLLRDLVGEGAANAAFVPVFSRTRAREGKEGWALLAQAVWVRVGVLFGVLSAAGVIAAPLLVRLVAPGFGASPELLSLTVQLTRVLFPFIGLVGLSAFFMGLLNSAGRFASPSAGPIFLNLSMIAGCLLSRPDAMGLSWGVMAGGVLQLAIQWPSLRAEGIFLSFRWRAHPGVKEIGRLILPRIAGTGVYQASVLVDTVFASFGRVVGPGGVASLYFAHRFLHLPLALFGISMAQAALPTLSSQVAASDLKSARETCKMSLRSSLFIAIPAGVGLVVLGYPIIATLLQRGAFSEEATAMTVSALRWYAVGLAPFCAVKVLANTLYAFHDTWTPVRSAVVSLAANAALNALLIWPMKLGGLALATSLSSALNCLHLYRAVRSRLGPMGGELTGWALRVLTASLGMGAVSFLLWRLGSGLGWLILSITGGVASFFLFGLLLKVEESRGVLRWLFRRN